MKRSWLNNTLPIAALFSFRMLGLFMLIPVFTVYATKLTSASPALIGIALGCYGLSQGLLQIPFGILSDKWGRKPVITLGLILFGLGSFYGAITHSIYGMIIARTLQGTGAIGSVLIALLADLTPDAHRTKAMAVIGVSIGISFSVAMVISPAITHAFGLEGLFYLMMSLALMGLLLLHAVIPTPKKELFHLDSEVKPALFKSVFFNPDLRRLNIGIFCLHFILTSTFFIIPMVLQQQLKLGHLSQPWHFYLPLMLCAFVLMIPGIIVAEKKQQMRSVFLCAVALISVTQCFLAFAYQSWFVLCGLMLVYFVCFNVLEASLPSLISKQANPSNKGTAMGIYSSHQFLGIFVGGACSGFVYQSFGSPGVFIINSFIAFFWLILSRNIQPNHYQFTLMISLPKKLNSDFKAKICALPGVIQAIISEEENLLYLRINKKEYKSGSAEQVMNKK